MVQPCDSDLKERFLSLIVCLFILFYFFAIRISRFFPLTFFVIRIFSIRIRHPQVSGPRFTDTQFIVSVLRISVYCNFNIFIQSRDISIRHLQYGGVCLHFTRASFNTVFSKSNFKITLIFSKMTLHFNYIV